MIYGVVHGFSWLYVGFVQKFHLDVLISCALMQMSTKPCRRYENEGIEKTPVNSAISAVSVLSG
jgi:hypothetical protein